MKRNTLLGAAMVVGAAGLFSVAVSADPAPPATQSAEASTDKITSLIKQLGDENFHVRQEATRKLKELGAAALADLRGAMKSSDPEIQTRAEKIVQDIERPPVPGPIPQPTGFGSQSMRMSDVNGAKTVDVEQPGRTIHIDQSDAGVRMKVTGRVDGEQVTRSYKADTPEQLKKDNPAAYALYQQMMGGNPAREDMLVFPQGGIVLNRRGNGNGAMIQGLRALPPDRKPVVGGDNIDVLREKIEGQMQEAKTPPDQREKVKGLLKDLRESLPSPFDANAEADVDARMREYNRRSDALRQALDDLKLPDPGDALPPPASGRLGVAAEETIDGDGLLVTHVLPDSRARKMGLREQDVVKKVNAKDVHSTAELRRLVTETRKGLVIEGLRDGKPFKVEEK